MTSTLPNNSLFKFLDNMKTKIIVFLLILAAGCNSPTDEDNHSINQKENDIGIEDSASSISFEPVWVYEYNKHTEEFELKKIRSLDNHALSGEILEKIVNQSWPKIQLNFIKISNDTAFVSIPNSQVLTQQMGTAGAEGYMISTTYSFTELSGVAYISFDFTEGDHAIPGVYNRDSWSIKNE